MRGTPHTAQPMGLPRGHKKSMVQPTEFIPILYGTAHGTAHDTSQGACTSHGTFHRIYHKAVHCTCTGHGASDGADQGALGSIWHILYDCQLDCLWDVRHAFAQPMTRAVGYCPMGHPVGQTSGTGHRMCTSHGRGACHRKAHRLFDNS